ncbi:MAG: hypothetical protein PHZ09_04030 [Eubacteriales bacterium]|jgi:hypothetical protein|nr:hypothetical protein [Eubacteriales bacterium]
MTDKVLYKTKKSAVIAFALLLLSLPVTLSAGGAGSTEDPLVTYSYINGTYRRELKAELLAEIAAETQEPAVQSVSFTVEHLTSGQRLRASDACEIILRSGGAAVFVESEENIDAGIGLSDCTAGAELKNGESVPTQHLLIIPRGDGRGVEVNTAEAYIMVRGAYEILDTAE